MTNGRARRFWGSVLTVVFGSLLLTSIFLFRRGPETTVYLIMTVLGVWMWRTGRRAKKIYHMYPDFATRLAAEPDITLASLASSLGVSQAQARQGLLYLYRNHCFVGAYEDKKRACIVFPGSPRLLLAVDPGRQRELEQATLTDQQQPGWQDVAAPGAADRTVRCPGCGAANRVGAGAAVHCEYCGMAIQGKE